MLPHLSRLAPDIGVDLRRPECVLARRDGSFVVSDPRGLYTVVRPDGTQQRVGAGMLPNGLAIDAQGAVIVADIGAHQVLRVAPEGGEVQVLHSALDGQALGAVNFVLASHPGELWITVSTQAGELSDAIDQPRPDGQLLHARDGQLRQVAGGLYFPNEVRIDASGRWLYLAETTRGRVLRAPLDSDGQLGPFSVYGPDPIYAGAYVDGIALDAAGNVWLTELARNAICVIAPDQSLSVLIDDPEGATLKKPTSIAFAGDDLQTVVVGSLKMKSLPVFRSSVPGLPLAHWR